MSLFLSRCYRILKNNENSGSFLLHFGVPERREIRGWLEKYQPDLVILREKSLYSIICYQECRRKKIAALTYNQSPLYSSEKEAKRSDPFHRFVDSHMPQMRMTPVRYRDWTKRMECSVKNENDWFVPFVAGKGCPSEKRTYCRDNQIHIVEVGKFEQRKNHLLMIRAFQDLYQKNHNVRLLIVGEVSNSFHEEYYQEVMEYLRNEKLEEVVTIRKNVPYQDMSQVYLDADLYVLSSSGEPAAYSLLEAMSYGVPVISSSENGTADYTIPGRTGDIFTSGDEKDLEEKMEKIAADPSRLAEMGKAAYEHVCLNYSFQEYLASLEKIPGITI